MKSGVSEVKDVAGVDATKAVIGVGQLTGELLHALRNPVSALSTSMQLLQGGAVTDPDDVASLQRVIGNELKKLNTMLARCTEVARLRELSFAPVDLRSLVHERLDARAQELTSRRVSLDLVLPEGAVTIQGDAAQLGTTFDALVSNALEAMSDGGGTLSVLVRDARSESVAGEGVVLVVRDTGRGIPAVALPNVFRLFYSSHKDAPGLGLTLARQVAAAHGGAIEIESEEGRGTEVRMRVG